MRVDVVPERRLFHFHPHHPCYAMTMWAQGEQREGSSRKPFKLSRVEGGLFSKPKVSRKLSLQVASLGGGGGSFSKPTAFLIEENMSPDPGVGLGPEARGTPSSTSRLASLAFCLLSLSLRNDSILYELQERAD